MDNLLNYALSVFMGLFAIMNPIANTPIFLGLVKGYSPKEKREIALLSTIVAFIIVTLFVFWGNAIFKLFGITVSAFKITGGILVFYVGFELLMSQKSKIHNNSGDEKDEGIAISPLAIPILAGPGTIVTAMNFVTNENATPIHSIIVIAVFAVLIAITLVFFILGDKIVKLFGENLITVISKLMGLILAIIGTGMITEGIKLAF